MTRIQPGGLKSFKEFSRLFVSKDQTAVLRRSIGLCIPKHRPCLESLSEGLFDGLIWMFD